MTAMSEIKRPMPETMRLKSIEHYLKFSDADEAAIGLEMRTAFGMAALQ